MARTRVHAFWTRTVGVVADGGLTGFDGAFAMPPTSGLVLISVPQPLAGTASAVFNTFRQIGGAVAIAVFGVLVAAPGRFVPGLQASMVATATLVLLVFAATTRISLSRAF